MEEIIKITVFAIISVVLYVTVKQLRTDYAVFVEIGAISVVAVFALNYATDVLMQVSSFMEISGQGTDGIKILIKSFGIAVITQFAGDLCRDNGNSALASCMEMTGRIVIIVLSIPLIRCVSQLAMGLIDS